MRSDLSGSLSRGQRMTRSPRDGFEAQSAKILLFTWEKTLWMLLGGEPGWEGQEQKPRSF